MVERGSNRRPNPLNPFGASVELELALGVGKAVVALVAYEVTSRFLRSPLFRNKLRLSPKQLGGQREWRTAADERERKIAELNGLVERLGNETRER